MKEEQIDFLKYRIVEYYLRLGIPVPKEAIILARTIQKMDLELEATWLILKEILPKAKDIVEVIDQSSERLNKDNDLVRKYQYRRDIMLANNFASRVTYAINGDLLAFYLDNEIFIWDTKIGETITTIDPLTIIPTHTLSMGAIVGDVVLSSEYLIFTSCGRIVTWNISKGMLDFNIQAGRSGLSPDGNFYVTVQDGIIRYGCFAKKKPIWSVEYKEVFQSILRVMCTSDGAVLICKPDKVTIIESLSGTLQETTIDIGFYFRKVFSVSPDGTLLAIGSAENQIDLWNIKTKRRIRIISGFNTSCEILAFSQDGELLASNSENKILLWETKTGNFIQILEGHRKNVNGISFSSDRKSIASSASDGTIKQWVKF